MAFINPKLKEIHCKIAYYGPPDAGKSTSLRYIYRQISEGHPGKLATLSQEENGTLFFDFLPLSLGKVNGYDLRFHFYTIPGQIFHDNSRKLILKGIDGIIFVADSRLERLEENLKSWNDLQSNFKDIGIIFDSVPIALQMNKRDLPNILPQDELAPFFKREKMPLVFETVATRGTQVLECFQAMTREVLKDLQK